MANIDPDHVTAGSLITPASPGTLSGDTVTADEEVLEETEDVRDEKPQATAVDLESQTTPSRRPSTLTIFGNKLSSSFTGFSDRIPDHWKPGFVNKARDTRSLEDYPNGFPRFAAYMKCDDNFLLARRYAWLHNRVMLFRQSELRTLELKLQEYDEDDVETATDALMDHRIFARGDEGKLRVDLMNEIDEKLKEYDDIVMRAKAMASLPKASVRNYNSVYNQIHNTRPFSEREEEIFRQDSDFAALAEPEEAISFDAFIEDLLRVLPCRGLTRFLFSNAEQRDTTNDKNIFLYDKRRIDTFIRVAMAFLAVALLLAPVVVLFREQDSGAVKIVVILIFTMFFSLAISMATRAKRSEVFAATAAYCAVLVVFLGNFVPSSVAAGGNASIG